MVLLLCSSPSANPRRWSECSVTDPTSWYNLRQDYTLIASIRPKDAMDEISRAYFQAVPETIASRKGGGTQRDAVEHEGPGVERQFLFALVTLFSNHQDGVDLFGSPGGDAYIAVMIQWMANEGE